MANGKSEKQLFIKTKLEKWSDFAQLNYHFVSKFVFRGQANSEWKLKTSLERLVESNHPFLFDKNLFSFYEQRMLKTFKWKYPLYESTYVPKEDENIEWLSIMQHYGAPTRMLDFTDSFYVAIFMAMKDCYNNSASIWCLNKNVYMFRHLQELAVKSQDTENKGFWISSNDMDSYIYDEANRRMNGRIVVNDKPKVYILRPKHINKRINAQQGLFAIPGVLSIPFEENLMTGVNNKEPIEVPFDNIIKHSFTKHGIYSQDEFSIIKIDVPSSLRVEIMKALDQMNITEESLFPGLEGLARSLAAPFLDWA